MIEAQAHFQAQFHNHFVELDTVIREAERYGSSPGLESRYSCVRAWMVRFYPVARPALARHYPEGRKRSLAFGWGQPSDPLEQLLACPSLAVVLRMDSGQVVDLLDRCESAIEHLKVPAATC